MGTGWEKKVNSAKVAGGSILVGKRWGIVCQNGSAACCSKVAIFDLAGENLKSNFELQLRRRRMTNAEF